MKKVKHHRMREKLNNRGFSLVEILISIAVLVIIMVPLMGSFFRSMLMNKKAEELQVHSNLAASIMEGIKSTDMPDIVNQFIGTEIFDIVNNTAQDGMMRLKYDATNMNYTEFSSEEEQATYYFAIHGIMVGSTAYDALIKMDSSGYKVPTYIDTMNNYEMPEIVNLDQKANGLLFSNGTLESAIGPNLEDDIALSNFSLWGSTYAQQKLQAIYYQAYLEAYDSWQDECVRTGNPNTLNKPSEPTLLDHPEFDIFYKQDIVKSYIDKTMYITVNNKTIDYRIEYLCNWPSEMNTERNITNQISTIEYANNVENVYIFYTPSIFQSLRQADKVIIKNEASTNPVNLFVAIQDGNVLTERVTIERVGTNLSAFTDIPATLVNDVKDTALSGINAEVIKKNQKDRIYDVTIQVCEYEGIISATPPEDRYDNVLYTLEATK